MAAPVAYALLVDEKLVRTCASFEDATALARNYIAINPPMRIEQVTDPAVLRVWFYDYGKRTWVETA